jgi:hypothetical protein
MQQLQAMVGRYRIELEPAGLGTRPGGDTGTHQPSLDPCAPPFAVERVDGVIMSMTGIELPQQLTNHGDPVFLSHQLVLPHFPHFNGHF